MYCPVVASVLSMQNPSTTTIDGPRPAGHPVAGGDASIGALVPVSGGDPASTSSSALASAPIGGSMEASPPDGVDESVAPSLSIGAAVVNASPPHPTHAVVAASADATRLPDTLRRMQAETTRRDRPGGMCGRLSRDRCLAPSLEER